MISKQTIKEFLVELSSDSPTPGGGAVAAVTAAQAVSLLAMVARLTNSEQLDYVSFAKLMDQKRDELLALADADTVAFKKVMEAYKLDKTDPKRESLLETAFKGAADPPLKLANKCWAIIESSQMYVEKSNPNVLSDTIIAMHLFLAAIAASATNVRVNLKYMNDDKAISEFEFQLQKIEEAVDKRVPLILERLYTNFE